MQAVFLWHRQLHASKQLNNHLDLAELEPDENDSAGSDDDPCRGVHIAIQARC